jgi:hypothetical protein
MLGPSDGWRRPRLGYRDGTKAGRTTNEVIKAMIAMLLGCNLGGSQAYMPGTQPVSGR